MVATPTCIPTGSVERLPFNSVVDRNIRIIHRCVSHARSMKSAHVAQKASEGTEAVDVMDPSLETPCHNWGGDSEQRGPCPQPLSGGSASISISPALSSFLAAPFQK